MRKSRIILVVAILIIVLGSIVGVVISRRHAHSFVTVPVTVGSVVEKVVAVGSIVPLKTAQVKSSIAGTVDQLLHDTGDYVTTSSELLTIKPQPTPKDYATSEQTVKMDLVKEAKDLQDVKRYQFLLSQKAISPTDQDYANAVQQYKTDRLQRLLDEQQRSLLERGKAIISGQFIGNVIYSPVNGYVVFRNVNPGDPVSAQTDYQQGTLLFVIADMRHMIFVGQVSQTDAAKLKQGMIATLDIAALPQQKITGTLTKLELASTQANAQFGAQSSGTSANGNSAGTDNQNSPFNVGFQVKISQLQLPKDVQLRAGYSANAELVTRKVENVATLPERVLHFDEGSDKPYVWILNQKNQPKKQFIITGLSDGAIVEVQQGLTVGEKVLSDYQPTGDH